MQRFSQITGCTLLLLLFLLSSCPAHSQGLDDDLNGTWNCETHGPHSHDQRKVTFRRESPNTYLLPVEGQACGFRAVRTGPGSYTVSPYGNDPRCDGTAELTFTANGKISGKSRLGANTEDIECTREGLIEDQEPSHQENVILDHTCHGIKGLGGYSAEGYKCTADEFAKEQQATTSPKLSQQVSQPTSSQTKKSPQPSKQSTLKLDHVCHGIKGLGGYDAKGHSCSMDEWAAEQPKK